MAPKVSFIIPYYNSGATIQETIDSILIQDFEDFDIWIVNDGSSDIASLDKLKEFNSHSKIKILHQENAGPSVARNLAISKTEAEFIILIDADDKISRIDLKKKISHLNKDESIGIIYGNLQLFGKENGVKIQEEFDIRKQLLWNQVAVCCIIKRKVFESVGYFDEYLSKPGLEDWEFWIRTASYGWKFEKTNEVMFEIRVSYQSRTFQVANKSIDTIKSYVYKKHASLMAEQFEALYYEKKMLKETPDYKIGNWVMRPYRFLKQLFT